MDFKSQIKSTVPTGTAPLSVDSSTVVTNLNANLLEGHTSNEFALTTHEHDTTQIVPTIYTSTAPGTSAAYFRIATIPITTNFKHGIFTIKAYTATGTSTEATVMVNLAYYAANYGSQQSSLVANASHSYNSAVTTENGWVLYYVRVSFDDTSAYIDVYKYKTTDITIQCKSLTPNDWTWHTGTLTANPTVGAYRNTQLTLNAGFSGTNISANYANSSSYSSYGILGTQTLSNTSVKTDNWHYFGYITFDYNSSYLRGRSINCRVIMQEMIHDGSVAAADLDDFSLDIRVNMGYHADGTAFNTLIPDIAMTINGRATLTTSDIAAFVYSSSTSVKVIRFYIKSKGPNTIYAINPINRYGRAFATSTYSQTTSYATFTYAGDQAVVGSLPTPAQGSVVYVTDIRYGVTREDQTKLDSIESGANNYTHPVGFSNKPTNALTGANIISQISVNNEGHITDVTTRALTATDIGAASSTHAHGNITNAGAIGTTADLIVKTTTSGVLTTLAAGTSGQFLSYNGTWATPPDTNTTYSAGNGLTLNGTTFDVVSATGTAGSVGTLTVTADTIGVTLGTTSTTAAAGNHIHTASAITLVDTDNYYDGINVETGMAEVGLYTKTINENTAITTGFTNNENITITYSSVNRTITLTGTFTAYYKGKIVTELVSGWVSSAHTNVTANYFLYYNGSFVWSTSPWGFDDLMIAYIQYGTTNLGVRETHGLMQSQTHQHLHQTIGTYKVSGGDISSYVLSSTTAANRRPDVSVTAVRDEDLITNISSLTTKLYTIKSLTGSAVASFTTSNAEIIPVSGNQPYWNQNNAGTWQQTLFNNGEYGAIFIMAIPVTADTNSQLYRYVFIQPQQVGNLAAIQTLTPNNIVLGNLSSIATEFVFIGRIIIQYIGNNWSLIQVDKIDGSRQSQISAVTGNYLSIVNTDSTLTGFGTSTSALSITTDGHTQSASTVNIADAGSYYTATNVETVLQEIGPLIGNGITATDEIPATPIPRDADSLGGVLAANYALLASPTFTGTVILPSTTSIGNVSATEIGYLDGVTSAIQTQLGTKAPLASPTFTGTVSGITAAMVGLGNVTNESKATMFTSAALTGTPTAPTATTGNSSTQIATTAFVNAEIANDAPLKSTSTGTLVNYIWSGTQAQYDAIGTKDANTLYFIVG